MLSVCLCCCWIPHPHLPFVPQKIFGTRGLVSLPNILVTGSQRFQIYRERTEDEVFIYKRDTEINGS